MYLGFLFQPTKIESQFIFSFYCACYQTMHPDKEINVLKTLLSYGELFSERAFDNHVPFSLIIFSLCL